MRTTSDSSPPGATDVVISPELIDIVINNIPHAAFWKDRELVYRWCNSTFARNAGLARWQDIVGLTDFDLPWTHSQSRAFREMDRTVINGNKPVFSIIERQNYAGGKEAWLITNKVPLHDAQGNVLGVLGTVEDVTDLYLAKEALRKANSTLEERVRERTAELILVNDQLKEEIRERELSKQAQEKSEAKVKRHRNVAEALQSTARLLSNSLDLDEVLRRFLVTIRRVIHYDSSAVLLIKGNEAHLEAHLARRWPQGDDSSILPSLQTPIDLLLQDALEQVTLYHRPLILDAPRTFTRWAELHGNPSMQIIMCVPIVADATLIGLISVGANHPAAFDKQTASLLAAFANQASAAIRNADLYSQAQHVAALEERQRIARELHDAVSQTLWSASVLVDILPDSIDKPESDWRAITGQLQRLIRGALSEMRTLLWELRPDSIANVNLRDLLEQLAQAVVSRKSLEIKLDVTGSEKLPNDVVYAVYRIVQEALVNVVKHAHAESITITAQYDENSLSLSVVDDGVGFDSGMAHKGGIGFNSMTERAKGIGAEITVQAQPQSGTCVMLNWSQ